MQYDSFRDKICRIFEGLGTVRCRPFAHVHGLYYGDCFFGVLMDGKLYFRTDDFTRQWYQHRQMPRFPIPMTDTHDFYEVPQKIIDRPPLLLKLAREAMEVCREHIPEPQLPQSFDGG